MVKWHTVVKLTCANSLHFNHLMEMVLDAYNDVTGKFLSLNLLENEQFVLETATEVAFNLNLSKHDFSAGSAQDTT